MLAVLAPTCLILFPAGLSPWTAPFGAGAALALALTGLDRRGGLLTRILASLCLMAIGAFSLMLHRGAPGRVLILWIALLTAISQLWTPRALIAFTPPLEPGVGRTRAASLTATASLSLTQLLGGVQPGLIPGFSLLLIAWIPPLLSLGAPWIPRSLQLLAVILPVLITFSALWAEGAWQPWLIAAGPAALALHSFLDPLERRGANLLDLLTARPATLLVTSFAAFCTLGTALLLLPVMSRLPEPPALLDAAFTAVSAGCVTGLSVLDLSRDLSFAGQLCVLLLIQIGGIGIMTYAALIFSVLGRRMSLPQEVSAAEALGSRDRPGIRRSLTRIGLITAAAEGLGALLLFPLFIAHGHSLPEALWRAIFTAISAFCNAGMSLHSESLMPYRGDPLILSVIGTLILAGGLGPLVVLAVPRALRKRRISLHARLALYTTAALVFVPALLFTAMEWTRTLSDLSPLHRICNALFQVIALRTAGMSTVSPEELGPATGTLSLILMFIGGSPGSTAGGLKTTTFAVLLLAIGAAMQGRPDVRAFGWFIPYRTVQEAASLATVGIGAILGALVALQLTQAIPLSPLLFEVVSALSTAGASAGATDQLDSIGKIVIMGCMFAGRVGPMTLLAALASVEPETRLRYPEAQVPVG